MKHSSISRIGPILDRKVFTKYLPVYRRNQHSFKRWPYEILLSYQQTLLFGLIILKSSLGIGTRKEVGRRGRMLINCINDMSNNDGVHCKFLITADLRTQEEKTKASRPFSCSLQTPSPRILEGNSKIIAKSLIKSVELC